MAIGDRVLRREDQRLLTGKGRFSDDFSEHGQLYAAFVRSPHPHARIQRVDLSCALAMPGVVAAYTGEHCAASGVVPIDHRPVPSTNHDLKLTSGRGTPIFVGPHELLPTDKVRHVGEALAFVVARTKEQALDGADSVMVDYDVLAPVLEVSRPRSSGIDGDSHLSSYLGQDCAPVWDEAPDNICVDTQLGDVSNVEAAFTSAHVVVEETFHIGRVTGVPLEPRAALARYEEASGRCTLIAGSGGAVRQRVEIAQSLGIDIDVLRVISPDVGGNFGTRNRVYVEFALLVWAARRLTASVKFVCSRSEAFLSDYQGRDLTTTVALAVGADGAFLALRAHNISNAGARVVSLSPLAKGSALVTGSYAIPYASVRAQSCFTTTPPTQAYRSSGRPEVIFAIERLVEKAAAALDVDSVSLRRQNLVTSTQMPYRNALGMVYDSGDYVHCLERALTLSQWSDVSVRREGTLPGRLRGIGVAHYVESSTGSPLERADITVMSNGRVQVVTGTQPSGQGHQTSFAQVAAQMLGIEWVCIDVVLGDTDIVVLGGGSHSGRSMRMAGTVISMACETLIERGYDLASKRLETARTDLAYAQGHYVVLGTDRRISLFELADEPLEASRTNEMHQQVFPNGCHVCEVEIDVDTGGIEIIRYTAVDDVGRAINPMIVEGQTHGGVAQGVGQALRESCVFDSQTGQPYSGSLLDYGLLRAADLPMIDADIQQVPSPTNPLGIKAGGEGGTTPALAAVVNAVLDALAPYGVKTLSMPLTSEQVWRAMASGRIERNEDIHNGHP